MSDRVAPTIEAPSAPETPKAPSIKADTKSQVRKPSALWALIHPVILFTLALGVFWMLQKDVAANYAYLLYLVPFVGMISLFSGWTQASIGGRSHLWYLIKQLIHWGGLIGLAYLFGLVGQQQDASVLFYLLAFATLLAAIHMDFKLILFAVYLVFLGYLLAIPVDNPSLIAIGQTLQIENAATMVTEMAAGAALVGYIATLFIVFSMRGALISQRAAKAKAH